MSDGEQKGDRLRVDGPIICPGHSRPVPDCKYSKVTEYGYFMMSACLDGKAMLREGPTGDWIGTFMGHKGAVWSARLNDDATLCATASGDFTAKIWDAVSGQCVHTLGHKHIVKTAIFSNDNRTLFTGGAEKKLRIYDLEKTDAEPQVFEGHTQTISYVTRLQDSNLIATASGEKDVRIWDLRTGKVVKALATAEPVTGMSASNDETAISTTSGQTVTVWDTKTLDLVKSFKLPRTVDCVAYHPSTNRFVTGSDCELWVRAYDFETGDEIACNKGHHGPVRSVAFTPDGQSYASGSEDGTIRIWDWNREPSSEPDSPDIEAGDIKRITEADSEPE